MPKNENMTNAREASFDAGSLPRYSVLMAVYAKDRPEWFEEAIESVANQSVAPDEIVIIEDGPISPELRSVESICADRHPGLIRCIALGRNMGFGEAMRRGVTECRNEWIARMDSDDISDPVRCEEELRMALSRNADIVGCCCEEFMGSIHTPTGKRPFPETHEELVRFSKRKTPFCHPGVMMKKSAVLRAGNYRSVYLLEDYDLFVRMLATGSIGCTVKKFLIHMRVGEDFYKRRGGMKYVLTLLAFNVKLLRSGWTSPVDFAVRSCGNILFGLSPVSVRKWLYRRLLRK